MNDSQNIWGEFTDRTLEENYSYDTLASSWLFLRKAALFFGLLFFLFSIPDYFMIRDTFIFAIEIAVKAVFLIYVVVLFLKAGKVADGRQLYLWISAGELILAVGWLAIFQLDQQPDLLTQSLGIVLILSFYYLLPNRWLYSVTLSVGLIAGFFLLALQVATPIGSREVAVLFYLLLVLAVLAVQDNRINRYQRRQYLKNKQLTRLASIDPLTGIHNRYKFDEELRNQINLSRRYQYDLSLIIYDYDDFKGTNDRYGHLSGDRILVETSLLVERAIRKVDTFARWGGEEFVILLPFTSQDDAVKLAERLRSMIAGYSFPIHEQVTCSFGITTLRDDDDYESFMLRVDRLLYEAKHQGKNMVAF